MTISASRAGLTIGAVTHTVEHEKWLIHARAVELAPLAKLILAQAEALVVAVESAAHTAVKKDVSALECRVVSRQADRTIDRLLELLKLFNDDALLTACMTAAKTEGEQSYREYLLATEKAERVP